MTSGLTTAPRAIAVDDAVYALTANGRIVSVFQIYEDAVQTLSSVCQQYPGTLDEQIVRVPVTENLDPERMKMSLADQHQLIKNAKQLTQAYDLDAFNHQWYERDEQQMLAKFVSADS